MGVLIDCARPTPQLVANATPDGDGMMSSADKRTLDSLASARPAMSLEVVSLANGVASPLFSVDMSKIDDGTFGCVVSISIEATDGVDRQVRTSVVAANVLQKNAGFNSSQSVVGTTFATSGGALTQSFSWTTAGNIATLNVTATSALAVTSMLASFYVPFSTNQSAVSPA